MAIKLYVFPASAPCQAVKITFNALNIEPNIHVLDYNKMEHLSEYYLKINSQHTAPLINDNGFVIWDSHAINAYLVDTYKADSPLYPKDPKKRAVIDQRLHFDNGLLFPHLENISVKIMKNANIEPEEIDAVREDYKFLEQFLSRGTNYIAANHLTIADFSIVPSLLSLNVLLPELDRSKYPKIIDYIDRCRANINGYSEVYEKGLEEYTRFLNKFNFSPLK